MNSVDFETLLGVNPHDPRLQDAAARHELPGAEQSLQRALAFEALLAKALAVRVPDDLIAPVLANIESSEDTVPVAAAPDSASRRRWLAMAASLVVGTGVGAWWLQRRPVPGNSAQASLEAACVEHLTHEPFALSRQKEVPESLVKRNFQERGVALRASVAPVHYSAPCPVGDYRALHLVVQAEHGPVTVLYLQKATRYEPNGFTQDGVRGRLIPLKDGSLVLLAQTDLDFDSIELRYRRAIDGVA